MSKLVLLTGSTGFVGRQILKKLYNTDLRIRLVVRVDGEDLNVENNPQIESIIYTNDVFLETTEWWIKVLTNVNIVIHAAWYTKPGKYIDSPVNLTCLEGTLKLANACIASGVTKFVGLGTCFEYNLENKYLSIHSPIKPTTLYSASKAATYFLLKNLFKNKINFLWCRLFYLFGDGEDPLRFIPYLRKQLEKGEVAELTDGNQIRDYLDVEIAGKMIVDFSIRNINGAVNICSGNGITIKEMAIKIAKEYNREDLLKFGVRKSNLVDPPCVIGIK